MHVVRAVAYVADYKLCLMFEDGTAKIVDLAPYLDGEIFAPLRDLESFKTVQVNPDTDTITWENGADVAPEFLYDIGTPLEPLRIDVSEPELAEEGFSAHLSQLQDYEDRLARGENLW